MVVARGAATTATTPEAVSVAVAQGEVTRATIQEVAVVQGVATTVATQQATLAATTPEAAPAATTKVTRVAAIKVVHAT